MNLERITELLNEWSVNHFESIVTNAPEYLIGTAIFVAFLFIARWGGRMTRKTLTKNKRIDDAIGQLLGNMVRVLLIVQGAVLALDYVNLSGAVGSLLAGLGVASLALAFAFRDILYNFIAGILLIVNKPIRIGDAVDLAGFSGLVKEISLRSVTLECWDGPHAIIPNATVFTTNIKNYTQGGKRRMDVFVNISFDTDLEKAIEVLKTELRTFPWLESDKKVLVQPVNINESSIKLRTSIWFKLDHDGPGPWVIKIKMIAKIKKAFDEAGIALPYPINRVEVMEGGSSAAAAGAIIAPQEGE